MGEMGRPSYDYEMLRNSVFANIFAANIRRIFGEYLGEYSPNIFFHSANIRLIFAYILGEYSPESLQNIC